MKIVVLDGYAENPGDLSWEPLRALGELTVYDRTAFSDAPIIAERIADAEIAVINKTPIHRATLDACPNLRLIAVLATGYNVVDCAYARKRGVLVANVPAYGTEAVAQFSIALLLELCHHIGSHSGSVHAGRWSACPDFCYWEHPLIELTGKTLGIIGFGRIGKAEARIAKALGMRILAFSPHPDDAGRALGDYVALDTLLREADVVSLHCPLTAQTTGLICAETLARMKPGALLINTARGQLLNERDVADALNCGRLAGAAMDVVSTEPITPDNPLLSAKNCILTPHIAWASTGCRTRILDTTAQNIRAFLSGAPQNIVNA